MFEYQIEKLRALKPVLDATGSDHLWGLARFLFERLRNPDSYVVFIGETSSGKSTIINSVISRHILPVSAKPTTGAITEIVFANGDTINYESLFRNGSKVNISDHEAFVESALHPDKNISRLRVSVPSTDSLNNGLRIFDTPGYNSIVEEHEEVLKEFLPNADIVIYTVNYKIGIQNEDFTFLRYLKELLREDVPIFMVVNRCPVNVTPANPRIKEIGDLTRDILGIKPILHIVHQAAPIDDNSLAMPNADTLIKDIRKNINSPQRIQNLEKAFDFYIEELFLKCDKELKIRLATAQMSKDAYDSIIITQKETAERLRKAIPDLIEPAFERITAKVPVLVSKAACKVGNLVSTKLANASKFSKDEEINFINNFYLPNELRKVTRDEIQDYIQVELTDLNSKVDNYINQQLIEFNNEISIQIETAIGKASQGVIKKATGKIATNALGKYFLQFGGNGGAGAGVANAASHLLKKAGDLVGKRFTRETHNAVKHFLGKIGATSMKAVGASIAILMELGFEAYDLATWKGKAKKKVGKALSEWEAKTIKEVKIDLKKLEEENKSIVEQIAYETLHSFDGEKPEDYEKAYNDSRLADEWSNKYLKTNE